MHDLSFWRIAISDFENRKSINISEWIHKAINKNSTHLLIRENNLSIEELLQLSNQVILELNKQLMQIINFQNRIRVIINYSKSLEEYFNHPEFHNIGLHLKSNSPYTKTDFTGTQTRESNEEMMIGKSCHSLPEVIQAQSEGFDYVFLSPIFPTTSHPGEPILGVEKLINATKYTKIPIIALGGVNEAKAEICKTAGASGFAGISWIFD